jgi:FtsZ-interacting cell division protein ZipA
MSDLQLSLLSIGVVVILAVVAYNWWQERTYRKLAQQRFRAEHDDVLLRDSVMPRGQAPDEAPAKEPAMTERIEPVVSVPTEDRLPDTEALPEALAEAPPEAETVNPPVAPRYESGAEFPSALDAMVDCIVRLELAEAMPAQAVRAALASEAEFDKPVQWFGRTVAGEWQDIENARDSAQFSVVVGGLQFADRAGPVSQEDLENFRDLAQEAAGQLMAVAQIPEKQSAFEAAQKLDEFCADVDVLVGVNVVATDVDTFPGTKIRALAEASGLKLMPDGTFQYLDERGVSLYSLANHESAPFTADSIKQFSTHGVTLLFDVPKVANGPRVFDQMILFSRQLADSLKGRMVDDNLRPLSDDGVAKIKQQLVTIYKKMDAHGIPAGGPRALRLFS